MKTYFGQYMKKQQEAQLKILKAKDLLRDSVYFLLAIAFMEFMMILGMYIHYEFGTNNYTDLAVDLCSQNNALTRLVNTQYGILEKITNKTEPFTVLQEYDCYKLVFNRG